MPRFNPGDYKDDFEPIPAGQYLAQVSEFERKTSQAGKPMLAVTWEIIEGDFDGRRIFDNIMLQENCLWRFAQMCKAMGSTSDFDTDLDGDVSAAIFGKPCMIRTKTENYNGKDRAKIAGFFVPTGTLAEKAKEQGAAASARITDDEIPF